MTYTCTICHSLNHSSRLHCQHCGSVPARYSIVGDTFSYVSGRSVGVATGAIRAGEYPPQRLNLRTVASDYYAEPAAQ